jgi:hypothetical protein
MVNIDEDILKTQQHRAATLDFSMVSAYRSLTPIPLTKLGKYAHLGKPSLLLSLMVVAFSRRNGLILIKCVDWLKLAQHVERRVIRNPPTKFRIDKKCHCSYHCEMKAYTRRWHGHIHYPASALPRTSGATWRDGPITGLYLEAKRRISLANVIETRSLSSSYCWLSCSGVQRLLGFNELCW